MMPVSRSSDTLQFKRSPNKFKSSKLRFGFALAPNPGVASAGFVTHSFNTLVSVFVFLASNGTVTSLMSRCRPVVFEHSFMVYRRFRIGLGTYFGCASETAVDDDDGALSFDFDATASLFAFSVDGNSCWHCCRGGCGMESGFNEFKRIDVRNLRFDPKLMPFVSHFDEGFRICGGDDGVAAVTEAAATAVDDIVATDDNVLDVVESSSDLWSSFTCDFSLMSSSLSTYSLLVDAPLL